MCDVLWQFPTIFALAEATNEEVTAMWVSHGWGKGERKGGGRVREEEEQEEEGRRVES